MWALKLLFSFVVIYTAVALIIFAAQTWLLFPTGLAGGQVALPRGAERIAFETPDGTRLQGVTILPAEGSSKNPAVILGFGGNAWNAETMAIHLHELYPEEEVVVFHYRGYGPSTGRPSAAAVLADGLSIYDFVREEREHAMIVAVGYSIGSGVAVHLAHERPLDGLILVTPFDTLEQLVREHYGWLPVGLLLRHHMDPLDEIGDVKAPVAIIAAERDTVIPGQRTAPLREAARNLIMDQTIKGSGHNDIYTHPEFATAMRQAMKEIGERTSADRTPDAARRD